MVVGVEEQRRKDTLQPSAASGMATACVAGTAAGAGAGATLAPQKQRTSPHTSSAPLSAPSSHTSPVLFSRFGRAPSLPAGTGTGMKGRVGLVVCRPPLPLAACRLTYLAQASDLR